MAEVEAGKLAQQKAKSEEVKKFGEHMIQDHGRLLDFIPAATRASKFFRATGNPCNASRD
jgi:predicted outer membrane protein